MQYFEASDGKLERIGKVIGHAIAALFILAVLVLGISSFVIYQVGLASIENGGRIATVRGFTDAGERGITFHPVMVRDYAREQGELDRLRRQAEAGQVTLRVARTLPAEQAPDAHRLLEAGGVRGRLVLQLDS